MQTVEAIIDQNGNVQLLKSISLPRSHRALLTILDDDETQNRDMSDQALQNALAEAYEGDSDADEVDFLRLANSKQIKVLDEWK